MPSRFLNITQDIYSGLNASFLVETCHENDLTDEKLTAFLGTVVDGKVGLAPMYKSKCVLNVLAIASPTNVLLIRLNSNPSSVTKRQKDSRETLSNILLSNPTFLKHGFRMDTLSLSLFHDFGLRISDAFDLLSMSKYNRDSPASLNDALGGTGLNRLSVESLFVNEEGAKSSDSETALQAWSALTAVSLPHMQPKYAKLSKVNTVVMDKLHLTALSRIHRHASRLTALKPTRTKNDINQDYTLKGEKLDVVCARYKTRVIRDSVSEIQIRNAGKITVVSGRVTKQSGRSATLTLNQNITGSITSITRLGREDPTTAEALRANIILRTLHGKTNFFDNPFAKQIWFPTTSEIKCQITPASDDPKLPSKLNSSQARAVNAILSKEEKDQIVLIQGPPGTGKTTVIAASVKSMIERANKCTTIWLISQSNVAVKNIAEKLAAEDFFSFKILVSKDFHFDWHEHLYERIQSNVIRSDDFVDDPVAVERKFLGSRVILCTLSMLSNNKIGTITRLIPPKIFIFDEASQIELGDYLPLLSLYARTIQKLVFIGDDKQLAPYGHGDIDDLESIFEKSHLRQRAILLDTQYRMPIPIGNFISEHVYDGLLKSCHPMSSEKCVRFINVGNGVERASGHSWVNLREIQTSVAVARFLHSHNLQFRIITPYDPQRCRLENALKAEKNLPWEDKCFNIDAFQGNEADFIIISLVRSAKLGFLAENRRVNVMLTRCKKGMIICTSRNFIEGKAKDSLVGKLAASLGPTTWMESSQIR